MRWFIATLAFLTGLLALDRGISQGLSFSYVRVSHDDISLARRAHADAYIFGDSRAKHHYHPGILKKHCGLTFFNAGAEGQGILYLRGLSNLLEQIDQPKLYVVNLNLNDLMDKDFRYVRLAALRPYMAESSAIQDMLLTYGWREYLRMPGYAPHVMDGIEWGSHLKNTWKLHWKKLVRLALFKTFCYNGQLPTLLPETDSAIAGFVPLGGNLGSQPIEAEWQMRSELDLYTVKQLIDFVKQARQKNIAVVFCIGPSYREQRQDPGLRPDESFHLAALRECAWFLKVPLIEMGPETYPVFKQKALYQDLEHLNAQGAETFSEILGPLLAKSLQFKDSGVTPFLPAILPKDYVIVPGFFYQLM